jgi:hypothetical protein
LSRISLKSVDNCIMICYTKKVKRQKKQDKTKEERHMNTRATIILSLQTSILNGQTMIFKEAGSYSGRLKRNRDIIAQDSTITQIHDNGENEVVGRCERRNVKVEEDGTWTVID